MSNLLKKTTLKQVIRIGDKATHNAFTDLIYFNERFWCVYREAEAHVSNIGYLRILSSPDGLNWQDVIRLEKDKGDLRDAKFSITPEGQLMLIGAVVYRESNPRWLQSLCWKSPDGRQWSEATEVGERNHWLWSHSWDCDTAYSVAYQCNLENLTENKTIFYHATKGQSFQILLDPMFSPGFVNEASLLFDTDQTAYCLKRRDPKNGLLGVAKKPYTDWQWHELDIRIGGPKLIKTPDGRFIASYRYHHKDDYKTVIGELDITSKRLTTLLTLPSSGDTSYPGLVWRNGSLWVSYYSSHEEKTAVYIAEVSL